MIARAVQRYPRLKQAAQRIRESGAGWIQDREVVKTGRFGRGSGTAGAFPCVQSDVMMIATRSDESGLRAVTLREFKAQDAAIKRKSALQVRDL